MGFCRSIGNLSANLISPGGFQNASEIAAMYQEYRIDKVTVEMMQGTNSSQINTTQFFSNVYGVIIDTSRDDAPLISPQAALAYSNCKTIQMGASCNA